MNIFKRKESYEPDFKVGDFVTGNCDDCGSFKEYFADGPKEVINVRRVMGSVQGDAITLDSFPDIELWSNYLVKVSRINSNRPVVDPPSPTQTRGSGTPLDTSIFWYTILIIAVSSIVSVFTTIVLHNASK
jgi:hypothetical protein